MPHIALPFNTATSLPAATNSEIADAAQERRERNRARMPVRVAVVGGGVAGISAAQELLKTGAKVVIIEDRPAENTVSALAAGLIEPVAGTRDPAGMAIEMAAFERSMHVWREQAILGSPFISRRDVVTVCARERDPLPWADAVENFRIVPTTHVHPDYIEGAAAAFTTYVVETSRWLASTRLRLAYQGVDFVRRHLDSLDEILDTVGSVDGVVNASGLGAAKLANDAGVYRGDGHIVHVRPVDGVADVFMDETRPTDTLGANMLYIIPRLHDIVIGGTLIDHKDAEGTPERIAGMPEHLLALATRIEPRLRRSTIVDYKVGARPRRYNGVRVELDASGPVAVVHCYGQGGSGWTLAPALAERTVDLLAGAVWAHQAA